MLITDKEKYINSLVTLWEKVFGDSEDYIRLYFKEFLGSDMLVTSVPVAILVFLAYFIPKKFIDMGLSLVFGLGASLVDFYYPIEAIILVVLCSVITRIIAVPFVVRTWRALWLSGSV